jgi:hypothetical protein
MGGFFYYRKQPGDDAHKAKYVRSLQALEKKSLSDLRTLKCKEIIDRDAFVIHVYGKIGCDSDNVVLFSNDEFILSTGTLVYRNNAGNRALRDLFFDFDPSGEFFNELRGQYCVFVYKNNALYAFNDYFGVYHVFTNAEGSVVSNSFLAVVRSLDSKTISKQALYEYLFEGTSYADETYVNGVNLLDAFNVHELWPVPHQTEKKYTKIEVVAGGVDDLLDAVLANLTDYFFALKTCFGGSVCTALSGGFDSRLILALLMKVGVEPFVYVYGGERSGDVRVSKTIGRGEGIQIHHDTKHVRALDIDRFLETVRLEYFYGDGHGPNGALTDGAEMSARTMRTNVARLQLNGGGGEIFRNFWKIADRALTVADFLKSKYDHLEGNWFTSEYDGRKYLEVLGEKVKQMLRVDKECLSRREIEMLYVYMRVKYWMGYNTSIQNYRTFALIPLTEPIFAFPSFQIPFDWKDMGRFEAELIRRLNHRLAAYPSIYGYNFAGKLSLSAIVKNSLAVNTPMSLRPYLRKFRDNLVHQAVKPFYVQQRYLNSLLGPKDRQSREFVNVDILRDPRMISRAYTVDLVMADPF